MHSLLERLAVITGGTSGIGLAVARNFVGNGAKVFVTGTRPNGEDIASEHGLEFMHCDASSEEQVIATFSKIEHLAGRIDVLVINAGIARDEGSIEEFDFAEMQTLISVNLIGAFLALKYAPGHMNDNGSIISTGSIAGCGTTNAGSGVYAASKAGVAYLTRTSALELAHRNIRANTVCPAFIAGTGMMTDDNGCSEARFFGKLPALGRMGRIDEVVGTYNFLASDESSFITGQEIRLDGGLTAGLGQPILQAIRHSRAL